MIYIDNGKMYYIISKDDVREKSPEELLQDIFLQKSNNLFFNKKRLPNKDCISFIGEKYDKKHFIVFIIERILQKEDKKREEIPIIKYLGKNKEKINHNIFFF